MSEKFEHKVQQLLGNIELEPGEAVWQNVKLEIAPKRSKRRFIFWWLLPVGMAGAGLIYYFTQGNNKVATVSQKTPSEIASIKPQQKNITVKSGNKEISGDQINDREIKKITPAKVYTSRKQKTLRVGVNKDEQQRSVSSSIENHDLSTKNEASAVTTKVNSSTIDSSFIAVQDKKAEKPQQKLTDKVEDTTAVTSSAPQVTKKARKWQFGIIAETGVVTTVKGGSTSTLKSMGSLSSIPSSIGGSSVYIIEHQQSIPGQGFAVGVTAKRSFNKKFNLVGSLQYVNQAFTIKTSQYKDSANLQTILYQATESFTLQNLNFNIGMFTTLYRKNNLAFGVNASVDNMYLLGVSQSIASLNYLPSVNATFQKNSSLPDFNKWQPYLRFGLIAGFTTSNGFVQLSPYLGYSLKPISKTGNSHLLNFGLSASYYFGR